MEGGWRREWRCSGEKVEAGVEGRGGKGTGRAGTVRIFSDIFYIPSYTFLYFYILLFTFIYRQVPSYTSIHPHIHQNIEYHENEGQHKTHKWS